MKSIVLMSAFLLCTQVFANDKRVCTALENKISNDCNHLACDDEIAQGNFKNMNECTSASDYGEYAQGVCDGQPDLQDLVREYNKKHPQNKVKCQD